MTEIADFLAARLREEEGKAIDAAHASGGGRHGCGPVFRWTSEYHRLQAFPDREQGADKRYWDLASFDGLIGISIARHVAHHDPRRTLRRIDGLLKVVEYHKDCGLGFGTCDVDFETNTCATLRLLALEYEGHSEYREEWR